MRLSKDHSHDKCFAIWTYPKTTSPLPSFGPGMIRTVEDPLFGPFLFSSHTNHVLTTVSRPHLSHWGTRAEMDDEEEHGPSDGLIYGSSFHLGRAEAPGGPFSYLMAQGSQSTMMPNTKRPLQNGRHLSWRWLGICLKEQKHRAWTMRLLSRPIPQTLISTATIYYVTSALAIFRVVVKDMLDEWRVKRL